MWCELFFAVYWPLFARKQNDFRKTLENLSDHGSNGSDEK